MILKTATLAFTLSLATLTALQALPITDFGTNSFEVSDWTSIATTPSGSSLSLHGQDNPGEYLYGTLLTPIDIGNLSEITLTASVFSNFSYVPFTLTLFSNDFEESRQYLGNAGAFGSSPTTITLSLNPDFIGSNSSVITGIMLSFGDTTDSSFTMTLTSLEAIPEPGVPLLIGFGLGATFLLRRVRRAASGAPALG